MEAKVIELTLAALLALAANFHDGLRELEAKQYEKAVASFTKVIEAKPNVDDIRELSLLHRAQAYLGIEKKDEALKDLSVLVSTAADGVLRKKALAMYTATGGDLTTLRPKDNPEAVMGKFMTALEKGDEKKARTYLSGGLLQLIDSLDTMFMQRGRGRTYLGEIGREFKNFSTTSQVINDTNRTAVMTASVANAMLTLGLEQKDGEWAFSSLQGFAPDHGRHAVRNTSSANHEMNKLRQLDAAIEQYTMANGKSPARLADAAAYVKNFADASVSVVDNKPFVFAIPKQGGQPWVFRSTPTAGQRQGIINGSIQTVPEETFKALAKQHGVRIGNRDWKKVELSEEEMGAIRSLIAELGAGTFQERKAAYTKLKGMGEKAGPLLDKATHNPDPEIALQARKLLDEL